MLPLKVGALSVLVGILVAAPMVWGQLPAAGPGVSPRAVGPDLPEPFLGAWQPAGVGSDPIGRRLRSGHLWLADDDVKRVSVAIALRWERRGIKGTHQALEGGGLFLSAVDLERDRQESYMLQPGQGGLGVWVTVAELEQSAKQVRQGPVVGGLGFGADQRSDAPLNLAAERGAQALRKQGWTAQELSPEAEEQMRSNGALVRYWTRADRTLQELVQTTPEGSLRRLTQLPRQLDDTP